MFNSSFRKFAVLAALLLAFGGSIALPARAEDAAPAKKTDAGDEKKPDDKSGSGKAQNHYIKIPPLILPVIGDNGVEQIISLVIVVEATSDDTASEINSLVPRLNDGFVTALYGSLDRREHMKNGVVDIVYFKQKLTDIAVKITGPDKIKNILIQGISQHQS